jgi:hypothetical protein
MNHEEAIRLTATERYLLDELTPDLRDQFEEHFFECSECAHDVRSAALFVEQTKHVLSENNGPVSVPLHIPAPSPAPSMWTSWFRPAFAVPAFAVLLAVILYQNFVTYPQLQAAVDQPQVLPWSSINTSTRGGNTSAAHARRGKSFLLFVNIPPDPRYSRYVADLYDSAGKKEWSLTIPGQLAEDASAVQVPTEKLESGNYSLVLSGIDDTGRTMEISRKPFELQLEN